MYCYAKNEVIERRLIMINLFLSLLEKIAEIGAGFLCFGASYEPKVPNSLRNGNMQEK